MALAGLAALLVTACSASSGTAPPASERPVTPSPSPAAPTIVSASISLDDDFFSIAAGAEGLWLLSPAGHVVHVDPIANAVTAQIEIPASEYGNIAVGGGSAWVTDFDHNVLIRIDPIANEVVADIPVGANPEGIAVTPDTVWVSNHRGGSISKIDIATGAVVSTFEFSRTGTSGPKGIVIVAGDLWTTTPNVTALFRLDTTTGDVVKKLVILSEDLDSPMTDGRYVYVPTGRTLAKIDPQTNSVVREFEPTAFPMVFGLDAFWSVSGRDLVRLDRETLEPAARWTILPDTGSPAEITGVTLDGHSVWVVVDGRTLLRLDPGE